MDRITASRMTIAKGLKWALISQVVLAVFLVISDIDARWLPRFNEERDLPAGPVSPGDQVRRYDPSETRPGFTRRTSPGVELPRDMPRRMEFKMIEAEGLGEVMLVHGPIETGDTDRFTAYLAGMETPPAAIALNSPGGVVQEALSIGRALREAQVDTVMMPGMVCLSSCPYVLAAGGERRISREASVGLHQHYYDTPGYMPAFLAVESIQHGQGRTLDYLIEMGVDAGLMRYSLNTPPEEIYVLLEEELLDTRLATEVTD